MSLKKCQTPPLLMCQFTRQIKPTHTGSPKSCAKKKTVKIIHVGRYANPSVFVTNDLEDSVYLAVATNNNNNNMYAHDAFR